MRLIRVLILRRVYMLRYGESKSMTKYVLLSMNIIYEEYFQLRIQVAVFT